MTPKKKTESQKRPAAKKAGQEAPERGKARAEKPAGKPAAGGKSVSDSRKKSASGPGKKSARGKRAGREARERVPVVAVGASAGGLEAFERFVKNVPASSGAAFIFLQHLDPQHRSTLPHLLGRRTRLQVLEIEDGMRLEPDCLYVCPPDAQVTVFNGQFHLESRGDPSQLWLPIDILFRSLAEEFHAAAIGVILSGAGSDGTKGATRINAEGGLVIVQDPKEADHANMPRNALAAGIVDLVMSADKMPGRIIEHIEKGYPHVRDADKVLPSSESERFQKIFAYLRAQTGNEFSGYKSNTIARRIARRMGINRIEDLDEYLEYLKRDQEEMRKLFDDLLIKVTHFFRDPDAFRHLKQECLRPMIEKLEPDEMLRIWVPACSTGEEAYSLAILVCELQEELDRSIACQIFATDLDEQAIERARAANYPTSIAADVSEERLKKFFVSFPDGYQVRRDVREMIVFATQNVLRDPPFSKMDLITCRNLLIYLEPELQRKIIPLFYYALNKEGLLFLGSAETVGRFSELFTPVNKKGKIYRKREGHAPHRPVTDFRTMRNLRPHDATRLSHPRADDERTMREISRQILLRRFMPAAVIVNREGDVIYFHGETEKFLKPARGEATLNLVDMAREGLKLELSAGLRQAAEKGSEVELKNVNMKTDGEWKRVDASIIPLTEEGYDSDLTLVVLEPSPPPPKESGDGSSAKPGPPPERIQALEAELSATKAYLRRTIREHERANEDLKSSNEELQSSNEELQSTNEELETSKEELQSVNEELATVNAEHQEKIQELMELNSDMNNLLASTEIATIFLDTDLRTKRFTPKAHKLISLVHADLGRPIEQIASSLEYEDLVEDCREVLRQLTSKERDLRTQGGGHYRLRIMPYRTVENVIDGVVLTFIDVTELKGIEAQLKESQAEMTRLGRELEFKRQDDEKS